jgi:hypothetical protein
MSKPKTSRERCWTRETRPAFFSPGGLIRLGSLGLLSHLRKFRFSDETFLFVKRHCAGIVERVSSKRLQAASGLLICGLRTILTPFMRIISQTPNRMSAHKRTPFGSRSHRVL